MRRALASSSSSITERPTATPRANVMAAVGGDRPLSDSDKPPRPDAFANPATAFPYLGLELLYPCICHSGCGLQPTNAFALAFNHIHEPRQSLLQARVQLLLEGKRVESVLRLLGSVCILEP